MEDHMVNLSDYYKNEKIARLVAILMNQPVPVLVRFILTAISPILIEGFVGEVDKTDALLNEVLKHGGGANT